ncbi:hypothetical protein NDU88_005492 [Pleurodeles waltl]|uniref:Uncharacterized protein n=1 Tax=Pleurodeles waltl TaxID=8319 RepID=A0AAV7QLD3_PLEWA|nr:hypothetical protein NDU88_005492 [Pleurodeles waltl]
MSEECMRRALALLEKAGRMDLVRQEALGPLRPACRASAGVAAAVLACSLPRSGVKAAQDVEDLGGEEPGEQSAARDPGKKRRLARGGRLDAINRRSSREA